MKPKSFVMKRRNVFIAIFISLVLIALSSCSNSEEPTIPKANAASLQSTIDDNIDAQLNTSC